MTPANQGLTASEVAQARMRWGWNELPSARPKSVFGVALEVVKEPMFLLLLACGSVYLALGDYQEGLILLSSIFLIIGITFYQYQKTEQALNSLRQLASPRALVIRDGRTQRIAGRDVVPGDILMIREGDRIAADGKVLEAVNLVVDESILTGESVPVDKRAGATDEPGSAYSGSLVVRGTGLLEVTATGVQSQFGKIGSSLSQVEPEETRLQVELKVLIRRLAFGGIAVSLLVFVAFFLTRHDWVAALLTSLSASMAILPEEFPVVLTVFLALGAWRMSKKNVLTRRPVAIETLGAATVLCTDKTGTLTQNKMRVMAVYHSSGRLLRNHSAWDTDARAALSTAALATASDTMEPMERAILEAVASGQPSQAVQLIKEYPLSPELLAMTRVVRAGTLHVAAKGAPEAIMQLCRLTDTETAAISQHVHELAAEGLRVIAVARAKPIEPLPPNQQDFSFSFEGLLALQDPIRPEVPAAIAECQQAGVRVVMITGDFPTTARSIGQQIGLAEGNLVTGPELDSLSDIDLQMAVKNAAVFARVKPEQKLRIVQALKANGEIVAMTGDGVNDAPALKAAHIGIAMGNKGTDVAREASSLVLLDDHFASIVNAIRLGRRIYDNLQKAMSYIMAIHIPIIGLTLLPAFFPQLPILLLPLHIVFLELIIDPICSVAFESEQEEKEIMRRPPRDPRKTFFGRQKIGRSVLYGLLSLIAVMLVYFASLGEGHTDTEVRAIAFTSLVLINIALIVTLLSKSRSFWEVLQEHNPSLRIILSVALGLLIALLYFPGAQAFFKFHNPGWIHFVPAVGGCFFVLAILETIKWYTFRKHRG
jgi:Ca2+-transporting ATPase